MAAVADLAGAKRKRDELADAGLDDTGRALVFALLDREAAAAAREALRAAEDRVRLALPRTTCTFFLKAKAKMCGAESIRGALFCGNHDPSRVSCVFDSGHRVPPEHMASHVRRCGPQLGKTAAEIDAVLAALPAIAPRARVSVDLEHENGEGDEFSGAAPPITSAAELVPLYSDCAVIGVNKPAGLRSVAGIDRSIASVQSLLESSGALIVHRLDAPTSGVLLLAKSKRAHAALSRAFAARTVVKVYAAVVRGLVALDEQTIVTGVRRQADASFAYETCDLTAPGAKVTVTVARVLRRARELNATLMALYPITGRSHQLRVHMLSIGHPIYGDALYTREPARCLQLHAATVQFPHPDSREPITLQAPLPAHWMLEPLLGVPRVADGELRVARAAGSASAFPPPVAPHHPD